MAWWVLATGCLVCLLEGTRRLLLGASDEEKVVIKTKVIDRRQQLCMEKSGFEWQPFQPNTARIWRTMSTVQIAQSGPSGFPARCSWVIGTRAAHWERRLSAWGDTATPPEQIFVQVEHVQRFHDRVLPCIDNSTRFVLITGDHDCTMPLQVDQRYNHGECHLEPQAWKQWLADDRIAHIFVEHLDQVQNSSKVTPIPLGVNPQELRGGSGDGMLQDLSEGTFVQDLSDFRRRPLRALRCDRVRSGTGQWADRGRVAELCATVWAELCTQGHFAKEHTGIRREEFLAEVQKVPFMFAVHGGGLDPNPKAWMALFAGAIPIMRRFPGDEIYYTLPVVLVDSWDPDVLDAARMEQWRQQLAPHFEEAGKRGAVMRQLMSGYWWSKVEESLRWPGSFIPAYDRSQRPIAIWATSTRH